MIKEIKIGNKLIGDGHPVYIIAEAGVNHNGSLKTALKLVDAAADAGADAVKFQTFKAEDVVTDKGMMVGYQIKNMGKTMSQIEMLKRFELKENFWGTIIKHCKKRQITFLSTPHGSFHSVDLLQSLRVSAFKIGSGDLNNLPVLNYAASFKKPMILGTGMTTLKEIKEAASCIKKAGNDQIIVLHCTTNYPCPWNEVNLRAMTTMREKLKLLTGYSDHTTGIQVPIMATTMGACLIEKHFTLDKNMPGPDHKASLEPAELKEMVLSIKRVSEILGSTVKKPNISEMRMIKSVRKSIVASKKIQKDDVFNLTNLAIKRPGTGIKPANWDRLLGKKAKYNYKANEMIKSNEI